MPVQKGKFGQEALPWKPMPYMDEYLTNLTVDLKAQGYIRVVKLGLTHLSNFCQAEGVAHPDELKRNHILRFQAWLQQKPMSVSYRQQLLKYVRGWINWLDEVGYIQDNPWYRIKVGSTAKKPKPLEEDEIELLFSTHRQQAFSIPPFAFHRREIILAILYGWGLRIHELESLNVSAMDMRLDWVTVRNKGGNTKPLPYGPELKTVVQRWLRLRGQYAKAGEDALLIDQSGKRLSIDMIRKIVTELGKRAGVDVNPHRFRDTLGTRLLDQDVPVERVMKILGHTNAAQTLAYSRVNDHKVAESHDAAMGDHLSKLLFGRTGDLQGKAS